MVWSFDPTLGPWHSDPHIPMGRRQQLSELEASRDAAFSACPPPLPSLPPLPNSESGFDSKPQPPPLPVAALQRGSTNTSGAATTPGPSRPVSHAPGEPHPVDLAGPPSPQIARSQARQCRFAPLGPNNLFYVFF